VGQSVDVSAALHGGAPYTVLLFARANCRACQNAKPMLAQLMAQLSGSDRVAVRVLAPARTPDEQIEYIRTLGLSEESLVLVDFRDYRIRGIPTLLLVNKKGEILRISQGTGESLAGFAAEVASVSGSPRP
jgi:thioredoxin-related protein